MDSAPTFQFDKECLSIKKCNRTFQITSDKKNKFNVKIYNELELIIINAKKINSDDIKNNEFENQILISELKHHKFFSICENLNDVLDELFNLIDNKKYSLEENIQDKQLNLILEVPMKKLDNIIFLIKFKEKDLNTIVNELIEQNNELKSKIEILTIKNKDFSDDIDYIKNSNEKKFVDFSKLITEKVDNLELSFNKNNTENKKELNQLITQVNILTKKVLNLEKDLETEKENNKKILDKLNEIKINKSNPNINRVNTEQNPPFHSSKSEQIPEIIFEHLFNFKPGGIPLGKKGKSKFHEHILVYSSYDMKDPGYNKTNYICDHCKEEFSKKINNYHCKKCHFDLCEKCWLLGEIKI